MAPRTKATLTPNMLAALNASASAPIEQSPLVPEAPPPAGRAGVVCHTWRPYAPLPLTSVGPAELGLWYRARRPILVGPAVVPTGALVRFMADHGVYQRVEIAR